MNPECGESDSLKTLRRIRLLTALFITGLFLSGVTAIPLESELNRLVSITGAASRITAAGLFDAPAWASWLVKVQRAIQETNLRYPFMAYGADWLAFGHFVIAVAFIGAWRDPVRNRWLFDFGLIACVLVVPYAMIFGYYRGIPWGWRLVDCSFGVFGSVPLWWCRRWALLLEKWHAANTNPMNTPQ